MNFWWVSAKKIVANEFSLLASAHGQWSMEQKREFNGRPENIRKPVRRSLKACKTGPQSILYHCAIA